MRKIQDHPAAIKFFHYHKLSEDNFIIITERPVNSKDLLELACDSQASSSRSIEFSCDDLLPLLEERARGIVRRLANVLKATEKKGFVHRDVKLDNILYDYDSHDVKLIDFGVSDQV